MNYEQKYKEALDKARDYFKANQRIGELEENDILSDIFPELKEPEDKKIKEALIALVKCNERCGYSLLNNVSTSSMLAWIEKQGETTIWDKKDEQILNAAILHIKNKTYNYSGGYTSEYVIQWLESLKNRHIWTPIEKQGEQNTNILWHDVSEEPEKYRELLCEWYAKGDINYLTPYHDIAFYHRSDKTFWNGEQQIENVIKWAYLDEMYDEHSQSYLAPKSTLEAINKKEGKEDK